MAFQTAGSNKDGLSICVGVCGDGCRVEVTGLVLQLCRDVDAGVVHRSNRMSSGEAVQHF